MNTLNQLADEDELFSDAEMDPDQIREDQGGYEEE